MLCIPIFIHLIQLLHHTGVLGLVTGDLSTQIVAADFSFNGGKDPSPRDTKTIVYDYFKYYGIPLEGGRYGLHIVPGAPQLLDTMTTKLRTSLEDCESPTVIQDILLDVVKARHSVVATTENDYTHALHGMFMIVINWVMTTPPFRALILEYLGNLPDRPAESGIPALGAQRSANSVDGRYFLPDWIISFPATSTVLQPYEILSTVEFKMGNTAYHTVCNLHDSYFDAGGTVVAIWEPNNKGGVFHYIPAVRPAEDTSRYDTMFDRIMEAAATALWSDTKLTLFMASERYFAAGPARGYGLRDQTHNPQDPTQKDKRDEQDDEKSSNNNESTLKEEAEKAEKLAVARKKFRSDSSVAKALFAEVANKTTVNNKVIYLPTYGTKARPAKFVAHVLALTMDKLMNWATESVLEMDHSASVSKKHSLDSAADDSFDDTSDDSSDDSVEDSAELPPLSRPTKKENAE